MKKTTKIYGLILASALVLTGALIAVNNNPQPVYAQTCNAGDSVGNLLGFATMSNFPSANGQNRIYMSTESWNYEESVQTNVQFAVSHNRQLNTWSGRGWNSEMGWVDFGENYAPNGPNRTATFEEVRNDSDGDWGNWDETIHISDVVYVTDPGGFVGYGANAEYTGNATPISDDYVGAGQIDFSNVQLVESPCNEYVDVTLNNVNSLYQSTCSINAPTIRWSTTNVVPGSCEAAGGSWQTGGQKDDNNSGSSQQMSGNITTASTPEYVRLRCVGLDSGATIYGEASAACGNIPDCPPGENCNPTTGIVIPEFIEV